MTDQELLWTCKPDTPNPPFITLYTVINLAIFSVQAAGCYALYANIVAPILRHIGAW